MLQHTLLFTGNEEIGNGIDRNRKQVFRLPSLHAIPPTFRAVDAGQHFMIRNKELWAKAMNVKVNKRKFVRDSIFAYLKLIQQTLFTYPQLLFVQSVLRLPPPQITFKRLRVVKLIFLGQSTVPFDIAGGFAILPINP